VTAPDAPDALDQVADRYRIFAQHETQGAGLLNVVPESFEAFREGCWLTPPT
jgi:hypothetical protein